MTTLRRRLTIAYTVIAGTFIALVAVAITVIAFDAAARSTADAIAAAADDARAVVASDPSTTARALAARVRGLVARSDIRVFVTRPPGFRGPPPQNGGPGFGPPPFRAQPPGGGPPQPMEFMTNVHGQFVPAGGAQLAIVPDQQTLEARGRTFGMVLAGVVVLGFIVAWLIARWLADAAVAPLVAVTAELRRFASGDFTPNAVPFGRFSDVGDLIEAYNGAGAQVAAAFAERERGETRMRRFLADAGHELRTPLSVVTAYIDVLRKDKSGDAHLRAQAFGTLASETLRMRRLVDRLVALARLEQPETTQPVVLDLGALARDAVEAIVAARGGDVSCEVESGTYVRADPADLHEAIANLVDNAVKYGAGSLVRVMVTHERAAVVVRVSDCGPGIDPADSERIFERFYRGAAQQDVDGSGLGLAIAQRAASRAGGELTLERSAPGETVFAVRLPLHVVASVS